MSKLYLSHGGAGASGVTCRVHPTVLLAILHHYQRRPENQERVVGTLLGTRSDDEVEITNCFPVPHREHEQVLVHQDFHNAMFELHKKINSKETIVGWYATTLEGKYITAETSIFHHEFYATQSQQPVHLVLDTSLADGQLGIKAFVSTTLKLGDQEIGSQFEEIACVHAVSRPERTGVNALMKAAQLSENAGDPAAALSDLEGLQLSMRKLLGMLDQLQQFVTSVMNGSTKPDPELGRLLSETLSSIPNINTASFETMMNESLQDLLMVVYLSNLTRTQLAIAERLTIG